MSKYFAYYREGNTHIKNEILFAACEVNFRFAGVGVGNIDTIIEDYRTHFKTHIYFIPSKQKLSNIGDILYISRQRQVDIITRDEEIIWNRFEGTEDEQVILEYYFRKTKNEK